ncbi:MAG TPA: glutathione S-transferase family protein [Propylenella sp.]
MPPVENARIALFYAPRTRAFRALWFLEELGEPYRIEPVDYAGAGHKRPEFLKLNPMDKLPTVVDDGVAVAESGAILAYLADKYPGVGLAPAPTDPRRADYLRWLFFAAGVMEPAFGEKFFKWEVPARQVAWGDFASMERTVTEAVAASPWLLGDRFSAADVYVGSNLHWGVLWKLFPEKGPVADYVERCAARPALKRALKLEERFIAEADAAAT